MILDDVTLSIPPGERLCIIGPSGSGKTLLLHLLLGLQKPTSGTINIDGAPLQLLPPSILRLYYQRSGFIREEDSLPNSETVFEIVALPLILQNNPPAITTTKTLDVLQSLTLLPHAHAFPNMLSKGERKLISIARALVTDPLLLFGDNPLEGLDPTQAAIVCNLFKQLNKKGTTLILTSRDPLLGDELHCRTLTLKDGTLHGEYAPSPLPLASDSKTIERSVKITAVK